jgi:hypothetical protein
MQGRGNKASSQWRLGSRKPRSSARAARRRVIPGVERFEDRTLLSLSIGTNFSAAGIGVSGGFIPPDTQGAAGPTQLVEPLNDSFSIFSKTGALISQTTLDTFFNTALAAGGGGSVTGFAFDPRIIYDPQSQRFFVIGDDNGGAANSFLIAVSNSSDATAGFKGWAVSSDPTAKRWMDYPTLGITADGVYLGGNMFPISGSGVTTALTDILVIPKADLTSGVGTTNATAFFNLDPNTTGFTPHAVTDLNIGQGLAQQPETILSDYNTPSGFGKITLITGTITSPQLVTSPNEGDASGGGGFFVIPARGSPVGAPQLGDSRTLDTGDTRFSSNIYEVGTNIWAVQGVQDPTTGNDDAAWYRIAASGGSSSSPTIIEQGTIASSTFFYYYPSIAVNPNGDLVVGYSGSSSGTYASAYASVGSFNGTTTTFGTPQLVQGGTGPYFIDYGTGRNRWGDYSATMLDPNDPSTFWTVQEFSNTISPGGSSWDTQFTAFGITQSVTGVSSTTANGTYGLGATIAVTVGFTKPVVVTGTPVLALNSGGTAGYSSGSGTNTLTFTYTVAAGQNASPLDEASTTALTLNGGTINDANSGVPAALALPAPGSTNSLGKNKSIIIATSSASVTGVSSTTAAGSYGVGSLISIQVAFNNPVGVTGTPQLGLNSGGTANYSSGSGTSTLTFIYTVAAGQNANPLDEASSSALTLNGGTINDLSNNPAVLTLPAPGAANSLSKSNIVIDTTAPVVSGVTSTTANGTYGVGSVITITVGWSEPVVVTGTPQLALNSGGTANYSSGSGTSTLTFTYTVGAGENTPKLDYTSTSALSLNGGTIKDTVTTNPNAANLTLPAPGSAGSIGGTKSIAIDTTAPTVTAVTSTTANGTYGVSSVITITVGWSKPVVVTGTPQLALNSGGTANYSSGSGTSTLTFTYTVGAGQNTPKLDYTNTSALSLNGGTIFDTVTNPNAANLTLPAPGSAGSIGGSKSIAIDTTAPTVTAVTSTTANGTYGIGSVITITVGWSKPVVVTGTPQLALNSGGTASYSSGSGTSTLTFTYTVAAGENSPKLDYTSTSALALNGGTIFDTVTNPNAANLTLPAPGSAGSIGGSKSIAIDTTAPTVTAVTSTTANGTYGISSVITIIVGWSKPVVVTGTPQLALNSGGTASYSSGSGTSTLTFTYTVAAGENSPKLDYTSTSALALNGGTIFDTVTNPNAANLTLPAPGSAGSIGGSKSIAIDTTAPSVTGVTSTDPNGTYGVGAVITITVGWSKPVVVTGTPQLALNSGGTATYSSGSGTSTLTFTYTVAAGENSPKLDYTSTSALSLSGGTIFDTVTNPNAANLTLPAPGSAGSIGGTKSIVIDTLAPAVTAVTSTTASGTYGVGSVITIAVGWSKPVVVTGTPQLALNSGGTANYSSGSGTTTLTFTYTVAAGQNANPLDEQSSSALTLNGGTINDLSNNPALLTLPAPGAANSLSKSNIVIDTTAPVVNGVTSTTANGAYGVGSVITITVGWSKPVVVTGTPQLALNSGGTANYSSGSGTSTLTFTYTVAPGENSPKLDYTSASALSLNGGTIFDTVTNPNAANLTLPAPGSAGSIGGSKSIAIDTTAPVVTNVTSTNANGVYGLGAVIIITVGWSKPVVVTGTPQLALNSGGTANYSSGSGTNTLTFTYTVGAGENSAHLDYASASALSLNGGTIFDTVTNPNAANLTLPAPGAAGSLGANKNIQIDTVAPVILEYDVIFGVKNLTFNLMTSTRFDLPWQITGIRIIFSKPITTADVNSLTGLTTTSVSGLGTNTLTWTISTITQGVFATTVLNSGVDAIKDAAGNTLASPFAQNFRVLYGDFNDDGFISSADFYLIYLAKNQPYNIFADLNGDGMVDNTDVQIARSRIGKHL